MRTLWCLGDSITLGVSNPVGLIPGYRGPLFAALQRWAFVGELYDAPPWDQYINRSAHHDGRSGYTIEQIDALVPTVAPTLAEPHAIALLIGTNNCSADTAPQMLAKLATLLATLSAECPRARVLVSSIPLVPDYAAVRAAYNAGIPATVAAAGARFTFVDACGAFTAAEQGVLPGPAVDPHPNAAGYALIAAAFAAAINAAVP